MMAGAAPPLGFRVEVGIKGIYRITDDAPRGADSAGERKLYGGAVPRPDGAKSRPHTTSMQHKVALCRRSLQPAFAAIILTLWRYSHDTSTRRGQARNP